MLRHDTIRAVLIALLSLAFAAPALRAPACLGDDAHRAGLRADGSVTGMRQHWAFDDMFSAFATQGIDEQGEGPVHPRGTGAARQGQCRVAEGIRLFHLRHRRRQEGAVRPIRRPAIGSTTRTPILTLHFTLPFKTPVKAKLLQRRNLRSDHFRRFRIRQGDAGAARSARRPAASSTSILPHGYHRRAIAEAGRGLLQFAQRLRRTGARNSPTRFVVNCP